MTFRSLRVRRQGVVLIVVVGVLAVLSLLAATFGMLMSVELAASRNQTEYEMARQAAHSGAEFLINRLQTLGPMTSGTIPDFSLNPADSDGCQLLYKREGLKVYFAVSEQRPPTATSTPDWMLGLGANDAGMFNINAMGFVNDLGSDVNPDIRYTSFDCSLVRVLTSRFDPASANLPRMSASDISLIDTARGAGYTTFGDANERHRVAILLSRAIINWRHGSDGVPGRPGTEERRLGHLPRWNSKLACANTNAGIADAASTPYPSSPGWGTGDGLPSFFALLAGVGSLPLSYFEPGMWRSYSTDGWGNDIGLPMPGLFWGKVSSDAMRVSTSTTIYADVTQPGWRDWPTTALPQYVWHDCRIYFATGPCRWTIRTISDPSGPPYPATAANTLTVADLGATPHPGSAFCIFLPPAVAYAPGAYAGLLDRRWDNATTNVGDLVPNAMLWPDGTLATERNSLDLVQDSGAVTTASSDTDAFLDDTSKNWMGNWQNYVVHIYQGSGRGQVRTIQSNSTNRLTINGTWTRGNLPDTTSRYRIELADNNLPSKFQPNNLQGDDRLYLSLGNLRDSVIVPALMGDSLLQTPAQTVADILLPYFQRYLSVSTQAIQASQALMSINDWAVDGVDNDASGVTDDPPNAQGTAEPQCEWRANRARLGKALYERLGLKNWAHADTDANTVADRTRRAGQLVANIIDFREPAADTDATRNTPTRLTNADLGETTPAFAVYGAKGLHVTQVMPSPDPITSTTGTQMSDDGSGSQNLMDGVDWDWIPGSLCWQLMDLTNNPAIASFTFTNLKPGYYALRLIGSNHTFTLTYNLASYNVSLTVPDPEGAPWYTGFVRRPSGALVCFNATSGSLTFQLQTSTIGAQFKGFALCAQYIQLTNISAHDILLGGNGWTVATDQTSRTNSPPAPPVIALPANYTRPVDGTTIDLRRISGAASTGTFPIRYGAYVLCMCEEAYEKQWSAKSADSDYNATTNGDGLWGNERNEAYVLYPFGDVSTDANTMALLMGAKGTLPTEYRPSVSVWDPAGNLVAGGGVDGTIPTVVAANGDFYSAIEKTILLQPTWDGASTGYWAPYQASPTALSSSQNHLVTTQVDSPRVPAGTSVTFRSCLNRNYAAIWDITSGYPTLATPTHLALNNWSLPLILNRPYPTTAWLGLVPTSGNGDIDAWRTVDPNPIPSQIVNGQVQPRLPTKPEELLGTLMSNATVGGVYARFNINTAPVDTLRAVFSDADASRIVSTRSARTRGAGSPPAMANNSWANWDELLNDPIFQNARNDGTAIGFYDDTAGGISNADVGAGTYSDAFPDNSDEREEWFRRFSNLFCLQSTSFRFTVAGLVYRDQPWDLTTPANNAPVAMVRIEMDVDLSTGVPSIVHFRYLGQ